MRRTLPFAAIAALGIVLVPLPGEHLEQVDWLCGGLLALATWVSVVWVPWTRLHPLWRALPLAASLLSVALLRDATGGAAGGIGALVLVPVVWVALYGDRMQLIGVSVGTAIVWAYPLVAVGAPKYPASGWRTTALFVAMTWVIGSSVQRLVLRRRADAAEREELLGRLAELAATDELTGLANRRVWDERLQYELARSARDQEPLSMVLLDMDRFKRYNDRFGHPQGDRLLRDAALAWAPQLRSTDLLARVGGEEFAVVLPACPLEDAVSVAERLRTATPHGETCSLGVAQWDFNVSASQLYAIADEALYRAKEGGRNRIEVGRTAAGQGISFG
jgi:diguanylate cyclase (GGDEF)-like protein